MGFFPGGSSTGTVNASDVVGLAAVAISGSYNDLSSTPTSSGVSDYNDLLNKPTLSTVATSGSYSDLSNKPSLASVATSGSYNDLSSTPTSYSANIITGLANVATSGSYNDLSSTPTDNLKNIVEDTTPELGGELNAGNHSIGFNEYDNGNSGTADTINWTLSNKQKSTLTGNVTYTFTAPSKPCSLTLKCVQDGTGSRLLSGINTGTYTFATTDVNTGTDVITVNANIPTGARIKFSSSTTVPAGLTAGTVYYAINASSTTIKVATTYSNAFSGTAIDITSQGTGTHTVNTLVKWSGGNLPVLSLTANSIDILTFYFDGTDYFGSLSSSFS
ncbi:MAG: hypothetical protein ACM3O3_12665 [Syntrophothermus sp.]